MVMVCEQMLERLQPQAIITESDRKMEAACLVLTARTYGIPTMTMVHGVVNPPYGYTPMLADLTFCWGKSQRDQLIEMGEKPERLIIAGYQRLSRNIKVSTSEARAKVGLPDRPTVLLATNPICPEHRRKLVRVFCDALADQKQLSAVVRLHPAESLDFYENAIAAFPTILFLKNDIWTLDEALAAVDIVVCHNSGLGNDSLIKDKFVIVLDVLPMKLANGQELIEKAGCPWAKDAKDLINIITVIVNDNEYRHKLKAQSELYLKETYEAFGNDAVKNIIQIINEQIIT
jgi:hypothetical protein